MDRTLLALTALLCVGLSIGLWVVGTVPFNEYTFALHVASIYIGVAGALWYQRVRR